MYSTVNSVLLQLRILCDAFVRAAFAFHRWYVACCSIRENAV